jgi:hypothetical protein
MPEQNEEEVVEDDTTVSSSDFAATALVLTLSPVLVRLVQLLVLSILALGLCILVTAL